MNMDKILDALDQHKVAYLLIGGVNFLLQHEPALTYDVDIWIADNAENLSNCEQALAALDAEWGKSDDDWQPVRNRKPGWLSSQPVFCLASPYGAIDVFRQVKGMKDWTACNRRSVSGSTAAGTRYRGLNDDDMLASQKALDAKDQKMDRIRVLQEARRKKQDGN